MYRTTYPDAPGYHNRFNIRRNLPVRDQLKASWLVAMLGCALFSGGIWILVYNEGRTVHTIRSLDEALKSVIPLQSTSVVIEENNGKLVHLIGQLDIREPLAEPDYGVSFPSVKLKRRVQMYQWVEEEAPKEIQGGEHSHTETSYSYATEWRDKLIDSSSFVIPTGHENPRSFPLTSIIYVNEEVKIGSFYLGSELKDKFTEWVLITSDERPEQPDIKLHAGLYYHSQDVWNPEVGDIRIQFSYTGQAGDMVTIVASQVGKELRPYYTSTKDRILILLRGRFSVQEVFQAEHAQNWFYTWLIRCGGWILLFLGSMCLSTIVRGVAYRYSVIHDLLALGSGTFNVAVSTSVSLFVISFAWLWYKPFLGMFLIVCALIPFLYSSAKLYYRDSYENRYRKL